MKSTIPTPASILEEVYTLQRYLICYTNNGLSAESVLKCIGKLDNISHQLLALTENSQDKSLHKYENVA
jgi:hypothetical protein